MGSEKSKAKSSAVGRILPLSFYARPAEELAELLLWKTLIRRTAGGMRRARIVETEAYCGPEDLACHSSKGLTPRTQVMFGPAGHAYVYLIYGIYQMLNITCGGGQAVLLRAAEPLEGWEANLSGPGRLARALEISTQDNALPLDGPTLYLVDPGERPPQITRGPRIGVDYGGSWKDKPLRFYDATSQAVSRPR